MKEDLFLNFLFEVEFHLLFARIFLGHFDIGPIYLVGSPIWQI